MRESQPPPQAGGVGAPFLPPGVRAGSSVSSPASSRCWTRSWGCPSVRPPALCRGGHPPSRCPSSRHLLLGAEAGQLRDPPGFGVELCAVADLINRVWIKPPLCARPHMPIDSLAVSGLRPAREPKPLAVVGSLASPAVGATGSAGSSTWISRAHLGGRAPGGTHSNFASSTGSVFSGPGGELPAGKGSASCSHVPSFRGAPVTAGPASPMPLQSWAAGPLPATSHIQGGAAGGREGQ